MPHSYRQTRTKEVDSQNLWSGTEGSSLLRQRYGRWSKVSQVDQVAAISLMKRSGCSVDDAGARWMERYLEQMRGRAGSDSGWIYTTWCTWSNFVLIICVMPGPIPCFRNEQFSHLLELNHWLQISVQRLATASLTTVILFWSSADVLRMNGIHLHMKGST